jgi:hypothetical protein
VFILYYASVTTDYKSHKAIYHTELWEHAHFYSNIFFCLNVLVTELQFICLYFYIALKCLLALMYWRLIGPLHDFLLVSLSRRLLS